MKKRGVFVLSEIFLQAAAPKAELLHKAAALTHRKVSQSKFVLYLSVRLAWILATVFSEL